MKNEKKLGSGIYFPAEEFYPALLLILCAFLKTLAIVSTDVGATVLYLNGKTESFPAILIATALLIAVVWRSVIVLKNKNASFPAWMLFAAGGISVLFYVMKYFIPPAELRHSLMVWKEGFRVLTEMAFWLAAIRFGVFSKKTRLLKILAGMQIAGLFVTGALLYVVLNNMALDGYATAFMTGVFDSIATLSGKYMMYVIAWAGVFAIGAGFILKVLVNNGSLPYSPRIIFDKQSSKENELPPLQKKLSAALLTFSAVFCFTSGILQYRLFSEPALSEEPAFLLEWLTLNCVLLALILLCFRKVFAKGSFFGLFGLVLISLPVLFTSGLCYFFVLGFLASVVYAKEAAMMAFPQGTIPQTGFGITLWRKSVIEPVALALSGIILLFSKESAQNVQIILISSVAVLFLGAIVLRQIYQSLVLNMLKTHTWHGGRLLLKGKTVRRYLESALNGTDSQNVLYALNVIEESLSSDFSQYLKRALRHKNEEVRLYALNRIEELHLTSLLKEVVDLSQTDECDAVRQAAVRVMCCLGGTEEREKAVEVIRDPVLRQGALTGLLSVGREGVFVAIENVAGLTVSENKEDRLLAATVLGNAGNKAFYHPLTHLLADKDTDVCKAALNAAGKLTNPLLLPAVMKTFENTELQEDACNALIRFKEKAFPEIKKVLDSKNEPVRFQILMIKILARMKIAAAEDFMFDFIRIEDRRIRFNIAKSLVLSGYKASGKKVNIVRLCLYDEMEMATGLLAAMHVFGKNKNEALSSALELQQTALNSEIEYIKERILLLLALLYPSKALAALLREYDPEAPENEKVAKIMDKILSGELKMLCMPLFEDKTLKQRLALLRPQFYPPVLTVNGYIKDIMEASGGELSPWTRACAVYAAGHIKDAVFTDILKKMLSDANASLREAAVWALGEILPKEEAAALTAGHLTDTSVYVSRMAHCIAEKTTQTFFKED